MARGYPTRDEEPLTVPDGLIPTGMCAICKRERVRVGQFSCSACAARLRSG